MKVWVKVTLGDVLFPTNRVEPVEPTKEYRLLGVRLEGRGPFIRETVLGTQTSAAKLFRVEAGDFIYSRLFACRGAFGVVDELMAGCFVSGEFPIFRPLEDRIDVQFLRYWFTLPSVIARVDEDCTGSTPLTRNRYKENFFLALEIPLPPLSEQRRIVAQIEALAAEIEQANRLRKEAVEEVEALLEGATSRLAERSSEKTVTIDELVGVSGLRNGKSVKSCPNENAPRCLMLSSMRNGRIDLRDSKPVPLNDREVETFAIRENDVFVVRGNGSKTLCGRAGRAEHASPTTIFPDLFIRVDLPRDRIDPAFFTLVWNSRSTREMIEENAKTTSGIWKINQGHILATPLPLPPLPEQRRIVSELDALQAQVDGLKRLQAETAAELDALLPAILDRAFKGEL